MSTSSALLCADILLFPDQTHIYRRYTSSPGFAQSFSIHLAAFASLDRSTREKVLDNAPAILSCEVKEQCSTKLIGSFATPTPNPGDMDAMNGCNKYKSFSTDPCLVSSPLDYFPYDMDFTPWLQSDEEASEPMEIDDQQSQPIEDFYDETPNAALLSDTSDISLNSNPLPPIESENAPCVDLSRLKSSEGQERINGLKTMIEESLEQMHTKFVEDGGKETGIGKAFACIIDHRPELLEKDEKTPDFRKGSDPLAKFFRIICKKFSLLSSVITSKVVEGPGGLNLLRICCEWVLLETLCYTSIGIAPHRRWLAIPAQELYSVSREGVEAFQPLAMNGAKPWKDLRKVDSAPLGSWTLYRGYIVHVDTGCSSCFAKVSDIRCLADGRYAVVYTWLYTREQVAEELEVDGALSPRSRAHLDRMWPHKDCYDYMLSTNRTITLWDTAISRAPESVVSSICYSAIYSTTPTSRRIWNVDNSRFKWMKRILLLEAQEGKVVK